MNDDDDRAVIEARQFIAAINSDYLHDVFAALRVEFAFHDEAQAAALDKLEARLFAMRDLLKQRLVALAHGNVPVEK
jgi:hypothetical protein